MKYEIGATDVKTTALEALAIGRGVCQDFARNARAASRCAGIPPVTLAAICIAQSRQRPPRLRTQPHMPGSTFLPATVAGFL